MRKIILLCILWLCADIALAGALDPWATWSAAQPSTSRQIPPMALVARGVGTNTYYVMEVDPANGQIPVSATFSGTSLGVTNFPTTVDVNYGTPGTSTPRGAAMLGVGSTAVSNSNPVPISDAGGSITVDATNLNIRSLDDTFDFVRIGDGTHRASVTTGGALNVAEANFPTTVDTNSGAAGASTIRTVLATRHEAVATPLAVQLSNGTNAVAYDSGAAGATVPRVVLSTRHEAAATPIAVEISNGSSFSTPAPAGRTFADSARNAYGSTSVTTGAWVQLIASTAALTNSVLLFDSSGQTLELGTGGGGSETRKLIIPPGGFDGPIPLTIPASTRVSVRAVSATASTGELDLTCLN